MSFTYTASAADWGRIAPELVLAVVALLGRRVVRILRLVGLRGVGHVAERDRGGFLLVDHRQVRAGLDARQHRRTGQ